MAEDPPAFGSNVWFRHTIVSFSVGNGANNCLGGTMDPLVAPDALDREIAALEAVVAQADADIAAMEETLVAKRRSLETLCVEVRSLRKAAALRPPLPLRAPALPAGGDEPAAPPKQVLRTRGMFGQIRTNDPRLPVLPGA
jgi:hypothetical protein